MFPFEERVQYFTKLVASNRHTTQGQLQDFLMGPSIHVSARRDHIYEDAFAELAHGQGTEIRCVNTSFVFRGSTSRKFQGGGEWFEDNMCISYYYYMDANLVGA